MPNSFRLSTTTSWSHRQIEQQQQQEETREREKVGRTGPTDGWTVIDFNRVENTGERGGKASCRRARTRDGNLSAPLTDEDEEDSP